MSIKIVLHKPQIPGNTGTIGRTCLGLKYDLILIRPYGFSLDDKSVRRAGLDYWKYVNIKEYNNFKEFISHESPDPKNMFFYSKLAEKSYLNTTYSENSYLIFGSETTGLPGSFYNDYPENFYSLPMLTDKIRSYNLSNTVSAVAFEAYRQIR